MENNQSCIRVFADKVQIDNCREILQANDKAFGQLSGLLALAGNEVRLKILFLLEEENELCPCDLSDILGMSIPAISQHLRKLKDGNIIEGRREGQTIFYSLKLIRNTETDKLIGARIVAPEGGELIQQLSMAIKYGITVKDLAESFYPYLTLSEGIKLAAITFGKDVSKLSCCAS